MVFMGVALGLPVSLFLAHLLPGMLYNVHPDERFSLAAVTFVLGIVTMLACYLPARRATRVDPLVALRCE